MPMAKQIQLGERVVGLRHKSGRYGSRQVVGKLVKIFPEPDDEGYRYIVEEKARGWLSGREITERHKCFRVQRA